MNHLIWSYLSTLRAHRQGLLLCLTYLRLDLKWKAHVIYDHVFGAHNHNQHALHHVNDASDCDASHGDDGDDHDHDGDDGLNFKVGALV